MFLAKALRLGPAPRLALVGAGGKTSALFELGWELINDPEGGDSQRNVYLSATTHLAVEQLELAEHHLIVNTPTEMAALEGHIPPGIVLFTGSQTEAQRSAGLSYACMDSLRRLADVQSAPLVIEADGSRQRPLKAPASHEPVIPTWVDCVVVVAGLSGLDRPLDSKWVHRPELFSELSGLSLGEPVSPTALVRVLTHARGGLKDVPPAARRVALLNQASTPELQAQANDLAKLLASAYQAVLVADLALPAQLKPGPDLAASREGAVLAVHEPVAGVILAGGGSSRLGQAKQLLKWRGQTLVRHVANTALTANLDPVVVVTGFMAEEVSAALDGLPLEIVHNADWQNGLSASVRTGLRALPAQTGGVVFMLADQPQIPPGLIRSLVESHASDLSALVAPLIDGERGNPVLFDRRTFPDLLELSGDTGGRTLFSRYRPTWVPWHDSNLLLDVDTPEDYQRLLDI